MTWILLYFVATMHGITSGHVEFTEKVNCEFAQQQLYREAIDPTAKVMSVCLPK